MATQRPTRPQKSNNQKEPLPPVDPPEQLEEDNRYLKRTKFGAPTIGRSPDFVETIGLGNLTVITADGKRNYT
jgi:hypothetical protein